MSWADTDKLGKEGKVLVSGVEKKGAQIHKSKVNISESSFCICHFSRSVSVLGLSSESFENVSPGVSRTVWVSKHTAPHKRILKAATHNLILWNCCYAPAFTKFCRVLHPKGLDAKPLTINCNFRFFLPRFPNGKNNPVFSPNLAFAKQMGRPSSLAESINLTWLCKSKAGVENSIRPLFLTRSPLP